MNYGQQKFDIARYHVNDLGSSEGVSQGSIGGKGQDRDEDRSCGPKVDAQGIQILPAFKALQL